MNASEGRSWPEAITSPKAIAHTRISESQRWRGKKKGILIVIFIFPVSCLIRNCTTRPKIIIKKRLYPLVVWISTNTDMEEKNTCAKVDLDAERNATYLERTYLTLHLPNLEVVSARLRKNST